MIGEVEERPTCLMLLFRQIVVGYSDDDHDYIEKMPMPMMMVMMVMMYVDVDNDDADADIIWHGLVVIPIESAEYFTVALNCIP